ncbi:hypothetical protein COE35_14740 [Priestia megaterium]|nr:hypothetical protein COI96_20145 [Priestia megaterium]PGY51737.1 hypothetical protein COE35_14740 [Priestia megaterium]PMD11522.1 hypothetical protein CJ194_08585 [Priestia megaterium]PNE05930.1 hypothetical protein C1Y47_17850 [Priestia megaterium]
MSSVSFLLAVDWRARRSLARKSTATAVSQADQLISPICASLNWIHFVISQSLFLFFTKSFQSLISLSSY